MNISQYIGRSALRCSTVTACRSLLTALGLIIGVTAVISIQVLGAGMAGAVTGILGGISDRTFVVCPNAQQTGLHARGDPPVATCGARSDEVPNVVEAIPAAARSAAPRYGHTHAA